MTDTDLDPVAGRPTGAGALARGLDVKRATAVAVGVVVAYVVLQQLFPAPAGVIVQGLLVGSLSALVAIGIALVYRANKVVNFAQADLGTVPVTLVVCLMAFNGMSFWIAVPMALALAVALGALIERLVIRRFSKAPRLILMVVTIGLAQILAGLASAIPFAFGEILPPQRFASPFSFSFTITPITFGANELMALVTVVAVAVALPLVLRRTSIGMAIRACAEGAERASLLGIDAARIQTVVWVLASVLGAVATLMRAGTLGLPFGSAFGPSLMLRALAAAVIGRMENFGVIFAAAAGIGVIETSIMWDRGTGDLVDPILLGVIIVALLAQHGRAPSRVAAGAASTWQQSGVVRPIPAELGRLPEVRWGLRGLGVALMAILVALPLVLDTSKTNLAAVACLYGILAVSLVILTGWAGEISLGQVGFLGIGAAVSGSLNAHFQLDLLLTVVCAAVVGGVAAVVIGLPALRIRGLFLAVTTLGFALATSSLLLNRDYIGFLPDDIEEPVQRLPVLGRAAISSEEAMFYTCLAALLVVLWCAHNLQRSRTARVLMAGRDNERAAQAYGISLPRTKLLAFGMAGFAASFAGGLLAVQQRAVGGQIFAPIESIRAMTMVVVGGLGSLPGALVGTVFVKSTEWFNGAVPQGYRFLFTFAGSGVGLVFVLMFVPRGLGSLLYALRDAALRHVATRRGLTVSGLTADGLDRPAAPGRRAVAPFWWNRSQPGQFLRTHPRALAWVARGTPEEHHRRSTRTGIVGMVLAVAATVLLVRVSPVAAMVPVAFVAYAVAHVRHLRRDRDRFLRRVERIRALAGAQRELQARLAASGTREPTPGAPLLQVADVDLSYGSIQVLFGVGLEVHAGEVIALLGTNGAGKSTVLRAISGLSALDEGRVSFDGLDIAGLPPHQIAALGISQVPGGKGIFTSLRVRDNLTLAGWLRRREKVQVSRDTERVLELFPILREKLDAPAGDLSGGQQQMLALAMSLVTQPRLLLIDELSLGLAPAIVAQLVEMLARLRQGGTTIVVVEQSVNVALTIADTAYFLEKGEVRFHGETAALLDRPDVLRSVYLRGAAGDNGHAKKKRTRRAEVAAPIGAPERLRVDGLTKRFLGNVAVADVSFSLHEGEILGIIGPNGAGKTTVFDLVSGFLPIDAGAVYLDGRDITALRPEERARLGLARSFQDALLFPSLTVRQALAVALDQQLERKDPLAAALGLPEIRDAEQRLAAEVDELIERVNIGPLADKFISELSTGSRRIVDLAALMGLQPQVVMLDEPSSGIAQREAEALGPLILSLRQHTGASLLVIEHDMPLLTSVADRLVALDLGEFVCAGDADTVLANERVVASYLGTDRATIERSGTRTPIKTP
jgi:ABC-type branched-subunit amino acid transport system ATPase component/ABC-type branched-subunit amino acid transport system permease subunit